MEYGVPVPTKPSTVYEIHEQAVRRWHDACKAFAEAAGQREQAEKTLEQACSDLAQHMQMTRPDPTQMQLNQASQMPGQPSNSGIGGGLAGMGGLGGYHSRSL